MTFPKNILSAEWLIQNIEDKDLVILDATIKKAVGNNDSESKNIQIPNSRYFDLKGSFSDLGSNLPNMLPSEEVFQEEAQNLGINKNSKIVVYDRLGIYSSPRVWWMFKAMGFENVVILDGGFPAWLLAGFPTEKIHDRAYEKGSFEAFFRPELVVDLEEVLQNIAQQQFNVLDARSSGRFNASSPEPRDDLKGGHIPKSYSLPYTDLLEEGKMKSAKELKELFATLSLSKARTVYSCGSGITACILMLASEITGNANHAIYDGSWTEWGQTPNVPIEI